MNKYSQGYLYIVKGEKYFREAENSAKSLKSVSPDAHVSVISDESIVSDVFDDVIIEKPTVNSEHWRESLMYKVENLWKSPYQKTLYVDADTYFLAECSELFKILDYYDICTAHSPNDDEIVELNGESIDGYFPYNTGVFLYRKSHANKILFDEWLKIYSTKIQKYHTDQIALMEALLKSTSRVYVLQNIYNARTPMYIGLMKRPVKIIHGRHPDIEDIAQKINVESINRCWDPKSKNIIYDKTRVVVGGKD